MTPYYQDSLVTLYRGDARSVFPHLQVRPTCIIADPPYGDTSLGWDSRVRGWPEALYPWTAETCSLWCFGSLRMFLQTARDFSGWQFAQDLVWEKQNGSSFHADRFKRVHEHVAHFYKGLWSTLHKKPIYTPDATARTVRRKRRPPHMGHIEAGSYESQDGGPRLMRSVIYERSCHGYAAHPTQKPVALVNLLLQYSVWRQPGASVLDPFIGSGTTAVACKAFGIPCIGIDIEAKYLDLAINRLAQESLDLQPSALGTTMRDLDAETERAIEADPTEAQRIAEKVRANAE